MLKIFQRKKSVDYPCIEPPFKHKPVREMNESDAHRHFDWFVSQSEPRRKLLLEIIRATCADTAACDYSPASLVYLWKVMCKFFESRSMTADEEQTALHGLPPVAQASKKFENPQTLTSATLCFAIDIGYYVAEIFMRRHRHV